MLTYKLIKKKDDIFIYEYYPEGDTSAPGIVQLSKNNDSILIQKSKRDFNGFYYIHALYDIDISKEFGTVAWY